MIALDNFLYVSALIFAVGTAGVLLSRNLIVMFMCFIDALMKGNLP